MFGIAVLGYGTVGGGVVDLIEQNREIWKKRTDKEIFVKYIVDIRSFPNDKYESLVTSDFSKVENDPEVQTVVETIGGARIAYEYTKRALSAGKNVVTSNKELVASHGAELFALAKSHGVRYFFEASVGGGIPILRSMIQSLCGDIIEEVYGILNGTTNYILTEMQQNGLSFETALKQAQSLGYAEANPDADILGSDACRKISILSSLAWGHQIPTDLISMTGISKITIEDINAAQKLGYKIKLLGRARLLPDGKKSVSVAPYLIPSSNPLYSVDGVFNAIIVKGRYVGNVMFYGPGAGKYPTASAVVSDVVSSAISDSGYFPLEWTEALEGEAVSSTDTKQKYMIRTESGSYITDLLTENELRSCIDRSDSPVLNVLSVF